jgi:hypothetical protein
VHLFLLVSLSCYLFKKKILLLSFILTEDDNPGKWIHPRPQMRDLALLLDFHTLVKYPPVREVCVMC